MLHLLYMTFNLEEDITCETSLEHNFCLRHSSSIGVDGQGLLSAIEHFEDFIKAFDHSEHFEHFLYKTFEDLCEFFT